MGWQVHIYMKSQELFKTNEEDNASLGDMDEEITSTFDDSVAFDHEILRQIEFKGGSEKRINIKIEIQCKKMLLQLKCVRRSE